MNTKNAEAKFLSILKTLKKSENEYIKKLDAYNYIKDYLDNETTMLNCFYCGLNDIHYVENNIFGKTIIDAGCGSGAFSILLSLLGARKVYAIDFLADCIEITKIMIGTANLDNIETVQSDIGELNFSEESVDGIFSIESISHYRNYKTSLNIASKVLKRGGFLVIRDGNNGASPFTRKKNYKVWDTFENHPGTISISGHHKDNGYYLDERRNIIKNEFTSLSNIKIEMFAKYTFAYSREKIIEAVNQFIKGDFSLKSEYSYGKCPLDPITDCYMELLIKPKDLVHELKNHGFKSKIYSSGPSRKSLRVLRFFWELFSPITIFFPRAFKIISIKK